MVDLVLTAVFLIAAVAGWRRGLLERALGLAGLLIVGGLAYHFLPRVLHPAASTPGGPRTTFFVLSLILGCIAQLALTIFGAKVMGRSQRPARWDSVAGAIVSVLVWALVSWFCVTALRPALAPSVTAEVDRSHIISTINKVVPGAARRLAQRFSNALHADQFPQVFSGITPSTSKVAAPDPGAASGPAVTAVAASVVKVMAGSPTCGGAEGSGWVVAPHRVVTNAHVVAGSIHVGVLVGGKGNQLNATVVAFDPQLDLAILAVPDLKEPALKRASAVKVGASTVVAGYPLNGNYLTVSARVTGEVTAVGRSIYQTGTVTRDVYTINGAVAPGNSGGPLLTTSGTVAGTVFARATDNSSVGYVLSDKATESLLSKAARLSAAVSTQKCTVS